MVGAGSHRRVFVLASPAVDGPLQWRERRLIAGCLPLDCTLCSSCIEHTVTGLSGVLQVGYQEYVSYL